MYNKKREMMQTIAKTLNQALKDKGLEDELDFKEIVRQMDVKKLNHIASLILENGVTQEVYQELSKEIDYHIDSNNGFFENQDIDTQDIDTQNIDDNKKEQEETINEKLIEYYNVVINQLETHQRTQSFSKKVKESNNNITRTKVTIETVTKQIKHVLTSYDINHKIMPKDEMIYLEVNTNTPTRIKIIYIILPIGYFNITIGRSIRYNYSKSIIDFTNINRRYKEVVAYLKKLKEQGVFVYNKHDFFPTLEKESKKIENILAQETQMYQYFSELVTGITKTKIRELTPKEVRYSEHAKKYFEMLKKSQSPVLKTFNKHFRLVIDKSDGKDIIAIVTLDNQVALEFSCLDINLVSNNHGIITIAHKPPTETMGKFLNQNKSKIIKTFIKYYMDFGQNKASQTSLKNFITLLEKSAYNLRHRIDL